MRKFLNKKSVVLGVVAAVVAATAAFAYWTTSGSGTGSGATTAGEASLSVAQVTQLTAMYPGDSKQDITATVTNDADNSVKVDSLTASIKSVTPAGSGSCDASDYALTTPKMIDGAKELAKGDVATFTGAQIQFNDKDTNQDGCKGASLVLEYTVGSN